MVRDTALYKVPMLSPDDLLILLGIQIAKDTWEKRNRMIKICDLLELIVSRQDWDWEQIIEKSSTLNCERLVCFSLLLAESLLGKIIPPTIIEEIKLDPVVNWYTKSSKKKLFLKNYRLGKSKDIITLFLERLIIEKKPSKSVDKGYLMEEFIRLTLKKILKFSSVKQP